MKKIQLTSTVKKRGLKKFINRERKLANVLEKKKGYQKMKLKTMMQNILVKTKGNLWQMRKFKDWLMKRLKIIFAKKKKALSKE